MTGRTVTGTESVFLYTFFAGVVVIFIGSLLANFVNDSIGLAVAGLGMAVAISPALAVWALVDKKQGGTQ